MAAVTHNPTAQLRSHRTSLPIVGLTTVVASTLPVLIAVVLFVSAVSRRPLLAKRSRWWWNPLGDRLEQSPAQVASRLTLWWSLAFTIIGALQGLAAVLAGLSITDPTDTLVRSAGALLLEALVAGATVSYLRRRSA
jgi:hypothetical protein